MADISLDKSSVVLLDVAGTTTSLSFVKDTLGPYVIKQAESFLKANWDDAEVQKSVKLLLLENVEANASAVAAAVKDLTEKNSDNEGLKNLQGLIARTGYEDGSLKGHVFADVPKSLESWAKDRKIAVFSTGSVEAQKLLFANSTEGDLSSHISKYFDPAAVGAKTESSSYLKIAEELAVEPAKIIYLSDLIEELKAAKEAGLATVLVAREGNPEVSDDSFARVSSFTGLVAASAKGKRKNEDEVDVAADPEVMPWPLAKPELSEQQPPAKVSKVEDDPSTTAEDKKEEATMQVDDVNGSEVAKETKLPERTEEVEKEKKEPTVIDAETAKVEEPMEIDGKKEEEKTDEAIVRTESVDKEVVETKDAETKAVESKDKEADVDEKAPVETVNGKAEEAEKVVEITNGVEKVEDSTGGVEKVEDNAEKVEDKAEKVEESVKLVEESAEKVEESSEKVKESSEKVEESSEKVEKSGESVEKSSEKVEESAQKVEETANGKTEEVEGKNGAVIEEKNGEAEKIEKIENGDAVEETTNGSHAATEPDEIKVKKVEVTSTEEQPPAVAV